MTWKVLKQQFSNLKLKTKFLTLFVVSFTLLFIFSIFLFNNSLNNYNKNLYGVLKTTLDLSTNNIEENIEELVASSYDFITDSDIQSYLKTINEDTSYDGYSASIKLLDELSVMLFDTDWVMSIHMVYNNLEQHYMAKDTFKVHQHTIQLISKKCEELEGKILWMDPILHDSSIILARQIRDIDNLSLHPLGTLIIRIDPEQLIQSMDNENINNHFMMMSDKKIIYNHNDELSYRDISRDMYDDSNYHIKKINNQKYFLALKQSKFSNWYFVNYMLYDEVVKDIILSKNIMFLLYILLIIIMLMLIRWIVLGMIKPIESLTKKMFIVEQGNFHIVPPDALNRLKSGDEIAHLEYDFYIMIDKINDLINENYKKQLDVKRFQFKALQAQINPHFLYNTLDSLFCLAKINQQDTIATMIKSLSNLLRKSISDTSTIVSIEEELTLLHDYINIQKFRYEERLRVDIDVHASIKQSKIPKLTLQPIIENAINYGLERKPIVCQIELYSELNKDSFNIYVKDNGCGMSQEFMEQLSKGTIKPKGSGIGIKNINARIHNLYGTDYGLFFKSVLNEGTTVKIKLPYTFDTESDVV